MPTDPIMQSQWQQTAIPWCTTHDENKDPEYDCCVYDADCVISTGGPDHKWWKDT